VGSATAADNLSPRIAPRPEGPRIGIAADSAAARLRIATTLSADGLYDSEQPLSLVEGGIATVAHQPLSVLVYAGDVKAEVLRRLRRAKREWDVRVVVVVPPRATHVRHAVGSAIDGVVEEALIETALGPTVRTVLAGQVVLPGSHAGELIAPNLSHREKEVLVLAALGLPNAEIAKRLYLAKSTVKSHLTVAFSKLGVSTRSEAAALVLDPETAVGRSLAVLLARAQVSIQRDGAGRAGSVPGVVPFVDLWRQHASLADDLRLALDRVAAASAFTLGDEVERFESDFAEYCEVSHCVGVASGTAALTLALVAAGIGPGDEVIVPAHTFIASALAIIHAGATPVLCDVERDTGLISAEAAGAAISGRTAAILGVHLYGQVCDMTGLTDLAHSHGLALFEDAAQAHGATIGGRRAGSLGTAAGFSFYPAKNLGALGDGGAICTDDGMLAERARQLRDLGQRSKSEHVLVGVNERLDGLQAALLRVKLPRLDAWNLARSRAAERYRAELADVVALTACRVSATTVNHLFPVRVRSRAAVAETLAAEGVQTGVHYPRALHEHPAFRELDAMPAVGALPESEAWAREELSLPMFPELEDEEIDRVIAALRNVVDEHARGQRT
jgi:dTDP-4-amino-4,6-dideoxygalactose transaminase/DNA-binding NarL/FixJ family response regulator